MSANLVHLLLSSRVYLYIRSRLIELIEDTLSHVLEILKRYLTISRCASMLIFEFINADVDNFRINVKASFPKNFDTVEDDRIDLECV
ncbi:MAG: hypothetical protein RM368_35040 [Nostoc sp. DedSLP03]|uniref:hypothetical protein n=1 Tax=Nostoc sp. DedSLP03 TaxID=3075400 RepID=UPI002AD2161A|nr:hypothetical protein [Nostoc sp. DedSLP03]MDZ7970095.1 hypothetical protein [Nostoc sp. DedSLP03]